MLAAEGRPVAGSMKSGTDSKHWPAGGEGRIPIPWRYRWRRFRHGLLPWIGFATFAALTLWLWGRQESSPYAIGEVEVVRVEVTAGATGVLAALPKGPWALFDLVEHNQVIAQFDDQPIRAQLATAGQELQRLGDEIEAVKAKLATSESDRVRSRLTEVLRLQVEADLRRAAMLEQRLLVEADRLELQRRNARLQSFQPLYDKQMVSELELNTERMLRDEVAERLEEHTAARDEAESQLAQAERRLREFPALQPADQTKELAPIETAVKVQQARIRELEIAIGSLTIRAPFRGTICAIHHWPGENVKAGDPIVALAAEQGRYIVSYLRQDQRIAPHEGMMVDVRGRGPVSRSATAQVERVGPQIEPIPLHQCRDPKTPEWGLPVRIALPPGFIGRPGELVEITFRSPSRDG
jgi:multidrug resistance efflux pump